MMNRWEIADITKVANATKVITNSTLNVNEFTKKQFDALFKGTKDKPSAFTLDWLREFGVTKNGNIIASYHKNAIPFIEVVRTETFTIPNKMIKVNILIDSNGNEITDYHVNDFKYSRYTRELVIAKYGNGVQMVEVEKPLIVTRNYYKINIDSMKAVAPRSEEIAQYYETKILELSKKLNKYQNALDAISATL